MNDGSTQGPNARTISGEGWSASIDGTVPVQAEGTVDSLQFFFRARFSGWQLHIEQGDDTITYSDRTDPNDPYGAGYMSDEEATAYIDAVAERFRAD